MLVSGNEVTLTNASVDKTGSSSGATLTIADETGSMFHVTNVTTTSSVFLDASADSWGSSGRNGCNVTLNLADQDIVGAITSMSNVVTNGHTLYVNGVAAA